MNGGSPAITTVAFIAVQSPTSLCERVAAVLDSGSIRPGGPAGYAIWLRASGGDIRNVTVGLAATPTAPHFTVCPSGHTRSCTISTLRAGQLVELRAVMAVPKSATSGEQVKLTAEATATSPQLAVSASAAATVAGPASSSPAMTSTRHPAGPSAGKTPAALVPPGLSPTSLSLIKPAPALIAGEVTMAGGNIWSLLPLIPPAQPGPVTTAGTDIGTRLPLIAPATPGSAIAPVPARAGVAPAASTSPLNRGLLGPQTLALAALCAAIGIVFATFAARKPRLALCAGQSANATPAATGNSASSATTPAGRAASDDAGTGPPKDSPGRSPAANPPGAAGTSALPATETATAAAAAAEDLSVNYTGQFIRLGIDMAIAATALLILHRLAARRSRHLASRETTRTGLRWVRSGRSVPTRKGWTMFAPRR